MIAHDILNIATAMLPEHRKAWGEAMRHEIEVIDNGQEALIFAFGCLWAACSERITVMKLITGFGRLGVGLVTLLYGTLFISSFVFFVSVLFFHAPDRFYDQLLLRHPDVAAARLRDYPVLLAYCGFTASSYIAAAICLIRWRPKAFAWCCLAALIGPALLIATAVHAGSPVFISFYTCLIPWVMLVVASLCFSWMDAGGKKPAQPGPAAA